MLSPKSALSATHPDVRVDRAMLDAFSRRCKDAGVSTYGGLQQLIGVYLKRPFKLHPAKRSALQDAKIPGVRDTPERVVALKARASAAGISHGEAIRQIVRRYIERGGSL